MLLPEACEQSGFTQKFQVAGYAGLALVENARDFANRQFTLRQDREQPQARRLGRCFEGLQELRLRPGHS